MLNRRAPFHWKEVPGKKAKHLKQCFDCFLQIFKQGTTTIIPAKRVCGLKNLPLPKLSFMFLKLLQLQTLLLRSWAWTQTPTIKASLGFLKTKLLCSKGIIASTLNMFDRLQSPLNSSGTCESSKCFKNH